MLFHTFQSQQERRDFGGSCFLELQYCRLAQEAGLEQILSLDFIENWKTDSLYIHGDDDNMFLSYYKEILADGVYQNGETGGADPYGINYYAPHQIPLIAERLQERKPPEYQVLLDWLENGRAYHGFYLLGL